MSERLDKLRGRRAEADARAEAQAASKEADRLEAGLREVRGQAAQRRSEAAAQSSQGGVVKALLAARAGGEIEGIHGRLGAPQMPRGWHTLS
jgi:chromosome segregation ATPase